MRSKGPHDEWSADGHDKLKKYGLGIWGIRDKFSGKWLGLWVLPDNRAGDAVAYCWLSVVRELGGKYLLRRKFKLRHILLRHATTDYN